MFSVNKDYVQKANAGKHINHGRVFALVNRTTGAPVSYHHTWEQARATQTRKTVIRPTRTTTGRDLTMF